MCARAPIFPSLVPFIVMSFEECAKPGAHRMKQLRGAFWTGRIGPGRLLRYLVRGYISSRPPEETHDTRPRRGVRDPAPDYCGHLCSCRGLRGANANWPLGGLFRVSRIVPSFGSLRNTRQYYTCGAHQPPLIIRVQMAAKLRSRTVGCRACRFYCSRAKQA